MMGSDEKVGVWMVVMVDNEEITGGLRRGSVVQDVTGAGYAGGGPGSVAMGSPSQRGAASPRFTGNKLYAEYLRREGRGGGAGAGGEEEERMSEEARERREVDHQFRDF
jgi:hypothetical protein